MNFKLSDEDINRLLEEDRLSNINNKIKKDSIYIKDLSCISINTTASLKKYISKENYSSILLLLIKKDFTYFSELRKLFNITTNIHLNTLRLDGLLIKRKPTEKEIKFMKLLNPKINTSWLKENHIYSFTDEAKDYFSQPKVYDLIKLFAKDGIDDYVILQRNEFEKKLREQKEQEEIKERELNCQLRKLGIIREKWN